MDTRRLPGLLFLLSSAAIAMPGCDDGSDDGTGGRADTDGTSTSTSGTPSTSSATASPTDAASESDSAASSTSGTTGESSTGGAMTTSGADETGLDSSSTGDTEGERGETTTGIDGTTSSTGETEGEQSPCPAFGETYAACIPEYTAEMMQAYCEESLEYAGMYGQDCRDAYTTLYDCLATLDCKELLSKEEPPSCADAIATLETACPSEFVGRRRLHHQPG